MDVLIAGTYNLSEELTGPEKYSKRLFQHLSGKVDVLFASSFSGNSKSVLKRLFGKEEVDENVWRFGYVRLFMFILFNRIPVIHIANYERFASVIAIASFIKKFNLIYTLHGVIKFEDNQNKKLSSLYKLKNRICESLILNCSEKILHFSNNVVVQAREDYNIDAGRFHLTKPGIDEIFFLHSANRGLPGDKLKILMVGGHPKREEGIIKVLKSLRRLSQQISVTVINCSLPIPAIEQQFTKVLPKLQSDDLAKLYAEHDIFIAPSSYETFSFSAIEAMLAGMIVIANQKTGMAPIIRVGYNGFIFGDDRLNEIELYIKTILENRSEIKKISDNAREIYKTYKWDRVTQEHIQIYQSLINR